MLSDFSNLNMDETLEFQEKCRICNGPIAKINTTYCYSNLLVRELAVVGIKVEHFFEEEPKE
jgi:hypothetical protein